MPSNLENKKIRILAGNSHEPTSYSLNSSFEHSKHMLKLIDKKIFTILPQFFKKILDLHVCSKKLFFRILTKKILMVRNYFLWCLIKCFLGGKVDKNKELFFLKQLCKLM